MPGVAVVDHGVAVVAMVLLWWTWCCLVLLWWTMGVAVVTMVLLW